MPRKGKGKKGGRKGKKGRGGGGRADSLEDDADASMVAAGGFGRGREAAAEDVKPGRFDDEEIDEDEVRCCVWVPGALRRTAADACVLAAG